MRNRSTHSWLRLLTAAAIFSATSLAEGQASILDTLRPAHPRLFTTDTDIVRIKKMVQEDAVARHHFQQVRANADAMLSMPLREYGKKGGTLLASAHVIENRILTLAGMYRLTGDTRYAARAKQEMFSAAGFPDWNPHHFLETAELAAAEGIGYDWLYTTLTAAERVTIRQAIVTKGIQPWLDNIRGPANLARMGNNWVQVCTGGITVAALAIAEEEPALAKEVLDDSRPIMQDIMSLFAPDGGFEEGATYWDYAVSYNVLYLDAVSTALGTDFGLSEAPGFAQTADYRIHSLGPLWRSANFSDAHEDVPRAFEMYWLANRFHKPEYQIEEERFSIALDKKPDARKHWEAERFSIFSLFWYHPLPASTAVNASRAQRFERINQAFLRSSWDSPDAWYAAFKGGSNKAHHAHLDLGNFILDAFGQRWGLDLGGEEYAVPGYFDFKAQRWTYFRTRTESHNTLVVDDANEDLDGAGAITSTVSGAHSQVSVMDLSTAYKGKLRSWSRGLSLSDTAGLLVQDEVTPTTHAGVVWHFHTGAKIKLAASAREATLTQGGASIIVRILSPSTAKFEVKDPKDIQPPPPQSPNPGLSDLIIPLGDISRPETIAVLFTGPAETVAAPAIRALSTWTKP